MKVLPLLSTLCILTSAAFVALGWYFILKGKRLWHQRMMTIAAMLAVLFLMIYLSRTIFIGNTSFGGPDSVKTYYTMFLIFHIFLAVSGLFLGVVTITFAWRGKFIRHKRIGPVTAVIWFCSAATGVLVYLILYIFWEPGPTTSVWKAILGL
ncbi:DUF420 domain-containing protein [Halobacillus karajensis]|nr:DUF420 domain-containing protein [Halobacillus karajensis]